MGYIHKLQHHGMLKAVPVMDKFFSLLMEMSLEYCVQDLEKQEKATAEGGDDPEKRKKKGLNTNSHFLTVDAFSDLIVLLIKCCGRGQQQPKPGEGGPTPWQRRCSPHHPALFSGPSRGGFFLRPPPPRREYWAPPAPTQAIFH